MELISSIVSTRGSVPIVSPNKFSIVENVSVKTLNVGSNNTFEFRTVILISKPRHLFYGQ